MIQSLEDPNFNPYGLPPPQNFKMKMDPRNRRFAKQQNCSNLVNGKESDIRRTLQEISNGFTSVTPQVEHLNDAC